MRIAICDDYEADRINLKMVLYRLEKERNIEFSIDEYDNPQTLLEAYRKGSQFQVLFMDVYMGEALGTDAAKEIRALGYTGSIIFCTTSEDHALDGFRVQADGYLVKPYDYEAFKDSIKRIEPIIMSEQKRVHFNSERIEYDILLADITQIETSNKGCQVHTKKETFFTWKKLKEFSEELQYENFYQIGRFSIVNLDNVDTVEEDSLVLTDGSVVFLPSRESHRIKQDINNYIWNKMRQ